MTGCSSGFGYELALQALPRGDSVIALSRFASTLRPCRLRRTYSEPRYNTAGRRGSPAVHEAIKPLGRVDIPVNNAGYILEGPNKSCRCISILAFCNSGEDWNDLSLRAPADPRSEGEILDTFTINLFSTLRLCCAILPSIHPGDSGTIPNIGSILARPAAPDTGCTARSESPSQVFPSPWKKSSSCWASTSWSSSRGTSGLTLSRLRIGRRWRGRSGDMRVWGRVEGGIGWV